MFAFLFWLSLGLLVSGAASFTGHRELSTVAFKMTMIFVAASALVGAINYYTVGKVFL